MKKMILIILFIFPSFFYLLLAEENMIEQDMYTLDGDIAKAIIIVYEQYCLNTLSNDAINSFNFVISNTDTEIHVTIRTKKLTLGGVASYVIDRDCYTIISEEYYE